LTKPREKTIMLSIDLVVLQRSATTKIEINAKI
jgi:hypothetical protein